MSIRTKFRRGLVQVIEDSLPVALQTDEQTTPKLPITVAGMGIFVSECVYERCKRMLERLRVSDAAQQESNRRASRMIVWEGQHGVKGKDTEQGSNGSSLFSSERAGGSDEDKESGVLGWSKQRAASFVWPVPTRGVSRDVPTERGR